MTLAEWIRASVAALEENGVESALLEAQVIAAAALGRDRSYVLAHGQDEFVPEGAQAMLVRRLTREPLAYILGKWEFYGRSFAVGPGVLIPRQETETLVEEAMRQADKCGAGTPRVLDVGTGSGILAITIKLERPYAMVDAVDVSEAAIAYARQNAKTLGAQVHFRQSDLFRRMPDEKWHVIVTNPPYVAREAELSPEVADHEPGVALYADSDGMGVYRRLAIEAASSLTTNGVLVMEVGDAMAGRVADLFEHNHWHVEGVKNDLSGQARVVTVSPVFTVV